MADGDGLHPAAYRTGNADFGKSDSGRRSASGTLLDQVLLDSPTRIVGSAKLIKIDDRMLTTRVAFLRVLQLDCDRMIRPDRFLLLTRPTERSPSSSNFP